MRPTVDHEVFRDTIGRFTTGVTVVSTTVNGENFGTTASAVSSLSMEPPMLLVCLNKSSETQRAILVAGRFAVNILDESQLAVAKRFATKSPSKFNDGEIVPGTSGVPLLMRALACLECRVTETVTGGTHTVFLAEVECAAGADGSPLTYYRGQFGRFESRAMSPASREESS
jgi:flavin reductase (DIM6/NTAB) family NADH-FMN oxidoreductase RutF